MVSSFAMPVLRMARLDEARALHALELSCFTGNQMSLRQFRFHLRSPRARVLVAEIGGMLLGGAVVLLRADSKRARLYSIMVDPQARGRGLGGLLLDRAEAIAQELGAVELRLEVRVDNHSAIALYEKRGYRRVGREPRFYDDGADAWRYARGV